MVDKHEPKAHDDKRPLRSELHENEPKPEDLNPAEPRPLEPFDASGQAGTPDAPPIVGGMPPVPPEPGGRDPAVEHLLREGHLAEYPTATPWDGDGDVAPG